MSDIKKSNLSLEFLKIFFAVLLIILVWFLVSENGWLRQKQEELMSRKDSSLSGEATIVLPQPDKKSKVSIEEAISKRRSVREYKDEALSLKEVSQILWSSQGITAPERGGRTAPSAGALYPLEVYLVVKKVEGVTPAVYRYVPADHTLNRILEGDVSGELARAALDQLFVSEAPVNLVFTGVFARTTKKYGERGSRYVHMEAGHAAQNVCLQVQSLGLGTVTVGAFYDEQIKKLLNLAEEETPLYIMPIGKVGS